MTTAAPRNIFQIAKLSRRLPSQIKSAKADVDRSLRVFPAGTDPALPRLRNRLGRLQLRQRYVENAADMQKFAAEYPVRDSRPKQFSRRIVDDLQAAA